MPARKESVGTTQWYSTGDGTWSNDRTVGEGLTYWRVGSPEALQALAGKVIRGWAIKGRIINPGSLRSSLRLRALNYLVEDPPSFYVSAGLRNIFVEQPDNGHPRGIFPPPNFDFSEVESPAWAGLESLSWAPRREGDPIPYPSLSEFTVLVSPRVQVTTTPLSVLDVGEEATLQVRLQYPDGEKVQSFSLRIGAGNYTEVRGGTSGRFALFDTARTNSEGVATFTVRGTRGGSDTVWIGLPSNSRLSGQVFDPPLSLALPITVREVDAEPPPDECTVVPGRPGVAPTPARYESVTIREWNAGANSVDELDGDVSLRFDTARAEGTVIGFTQNRDIEAVGTIERITHGFYFHYTASGASVYRVIESGKSVTAPAPHVPTHTFEVRRVGTTVFYFVEGVEVYRSRVPSSGALSVGSALYASGDTAA